MKDKSVLRWRFLARGSYDELDAKQKQAADYLEANPHHHGLRVVASNPDFRGRTKSDFEIACENRPVRRGMPDYEIGYGKRNGRWVELYTPTSPGMPAQRRRGRPPGSKNRPKA